MNSLLLLLALGMQGDPPDAQQRPPEPMSLPRALACPRGDRAIDVDGSLVDWPELPSIHLSDLRQLSGTWNGAWRSAADLSAFAFVMWDEHDLWFAAAVKDEWHLTIDAPVRARTEIPVADAILLSIDPLRNTRSFGPDPGRADDVELWLAEEPSHEVLQWDRLRGTAHMLTDEDEAPEHRARLVVSHDKVEGVTNYELRVPWSDLLQPGQKAQPGFTFDMQIVIQDFDDTTDPMPQTRIGWTFGCGVTADAALFGAVTLVDDCGDLAHHTPDPVQRRDIELPDELTRAHWQHFVDDLRGHPPAVHDGRNAPEAAGGIARLELLEHLDYEIGRYPRIDALEFCQRIQRRMAREVAAAEQHGLPAFQALLGPQVAKSIEATVASGTARLIRMPMGGWIVRGERQGFMVDPAGADAATIFWGGADFVLLTEPIEMTKRSDPLLLRLADAKPARPFLTHIAIPLPKLRMEDMTLIDPGTTHLQSDGAIVHALGKKEADGKVPYSIGYQVELPGRLVILFAGPAMRVEDIPPLHSHCLVLTARNPFALPLAAAMAPELVVLDDVFRCFLEPDAGRIDLATAFAVQKALLPLRSVLLAPGESWEISTHQ